jgi:hypothetical protein
LYDYPSNNLKHLPEVATVLECQEKCQKYDSCERFTIFKSQTTSAGCYFKSLVDNGIHAPANDIIAGPKFCPGIIK